MLHQGGDTSIHMYSDLRPQSKSLVKSQAKKSGKVKGHSDYKGPVGQESTSYKGITIDTYAVGGKIYGIVYGKSITCKFLP